MKNLDNVADKANQIFESWLSANNCFAIIAIDPANNPPEDYRGGDFAFCIKNNKRFNIEIINNKSLEEIAYIEYGYYVTSKEIFFNLNIRNIELDCSLINNSIKSYKKTDDNNNHLIDDIICAFQLVKQLRELFKDQ